jgi:hypothetical protein
MHKIHHVRRSLCINRAYFRIAISGAVGDHPSTPPWAYVERTPEPCPVCENVDVLVGHHDHFRNWFDTFIGPTAVLLPLRRPPVRESRFQRIRRPAATGTRASQARSGGNGPAGEPTIRGA